MMRTTRLVDLLRDICRERDFDPAWQGRLPFDEMPRLTTAPISSALDECRCDVGLGALQVFPLIPVGGP